MLNLNKKTAVILISDGMPKSPEDVGGFLFRFFHDRAITAIFQPLRFFIAYLRAAFKSKKVTTLFSQITHHQHFAQILESQSYALEKELSFGGDFKVINLTKYGTPSRADALKTIADYQPDQLIILPLYPQFSLIDMGMFMQHFVDKVRLENKTHMKIKYAPCFPQATSFIRAHSLLIEKTIREHLKHFDHLRLLFVAPGIPSRDVAKGDPNFAQIEMTTKAVVDNLARLVDVKRDNIDYTICYHAKMGVVEYSKPTLAYQLKKLMLTDKIPVVIPIAATCESIATACFLDRYYRDFASKIGLKDYLLCPTLNHDGNFIQSLAEICREIDQDDAFLYQD